MRVAALAVTGILLAGCSMNRSVFPANGERPAMVTVSAYTSSGCTENLRREAMQRGWEIKEFHDRMDIGALIIEIGLFPLVKGVSCSAQIVRGEIPNDF